MKHKDTKTQRYTNKDFDFDFDFDFDEEDGNQTIKEVISLELGRCREREQQRILYTIRNFIEILIYNL